MEKDILAGETRELEILEFKAGGNSYGINVSDVREILPYNTKPTPIPNSHPFIEGIIMPRDFLIPIINLTSSLRLTTTDEDKNEMLIVTSLNDLNIAIHVDSVNGIHRTYNTELKKPGKKLTTTAKNAVAAILEIDDRKIEVLELRNLFNEINPETILG